MFDDTELIYQLRVNQDPIVTQRIIDAACGPHKRCAISGVSLAGCDLSGLRLTHVKMSDVDLQDCICRATTFPPLVGCRLSGADATEAHFTRLDDCQFAHATLTRAYFGARTHGCDFGLATLAFATFGQILSEHVHEYRGSRFHGAYLEGIDAPGAYFSGSSFEDARLHLSRLSRADLSGCNLRGADLSGANLARARFDEGQIRETNLENCVVTNAQAAKLQSLPPSNTSRIVISSRQPGEQTTRLERELNQISEFRLTWNATQVSLNRKDKILFARDESQHRGFEAASFRSDNRMCIRTYPWNDRQSVSEIFADLAADYSNWVIDRPSLSILKCPASLTNRLMPLLNDVLDELFIVA